MEQLVNVYTYHICINIFSYKIYKEYEFIYEEENIKKHGIIDLILENDDEVLIIDYKLKHIVDSNYIKQLNGYKEYLSLKIDKPISIYLYSILDENLEKLM
jgi:ATP-dependent exoDNAse (exonuclease V) beta subunit